MRGGESVRNIGFSLKGMDLLRVQGRVILALMLHDIRSRAGGSALGFLVAAIGWPLANILVVLLINTLLSRAVPYGESALLWFATGVVPFLAFQYMARFIMQGIVQNRALLSFPMVKVMDLLLARAAVEVLDTGAVVLITFAVLWALGVNFFPPDPVQACFAILAMMSLGFSFGLINGILAAAFPAWIIGFVLLQIILWATSGILFVPEMLPEYIRMPITYNPTLQGVGWMRAAFYRDYGVEIIDKLYIIKVSLIFLMFGLLGERSLRGRLM